MSQKYLTLSVIPSNSIPELKLCIIPVMNMAGPKQKRITKYTLDIFLDRARNIHGTKYDYSKIKPSDINGRDSHVPVKCNTCGHEWNPTIHGHITHKSKCPMCAGNAPWLASQPGRIFDPFGTLERFLIRALQINNDKFDYSSVKREHIKNNESHVPVSCNVCGHKWTPNIHDHINHKGGCLGCVNRIPWTLPRFLIRAKEVHGEIYDYANIIETDVVNCNSYILIVCKTCLYEWNPTLDSHVKGSGCPKCKKSKGEKACMRILEGINIVYKLQFRISSLPSRPFDLYFEYMGHKWLLEFDGRQHFQMIDFFHESMEEFHNNQEIDVVKTKIAVTEGYNVIHIDHTQIKNIKYHVESAFRLKQLVYFSTPDLYQHHNL
ncbi:Hypothetical protein HVR_LOCUS214 [uncultured virus]|nr:Hypothetical protein HVR_LOCUS214 [uncultured virus]